MHWSVVPALRRPARLPPNDLDAVPRRGEPAADLARSRRFMPEDPANRDLPVTPPREGCCSQEDDPVEPDKPMHDPDKRRFALICH
jgi:hypothetical protein